MNADLLPAPHGLVGAWTTQDLIGTQTALHFVRPAVSFHEIVASAAAHLVGTG